MAKVLVTGGAGFIGSHLIDKLLEHEYQVTVLDNFSTGKRENLGGTNLGDITRKGLDVIAGDITDPDICSYVMTGVDIVVHLAAMNRALKSIIDPVSCYQNNIIGTHNVITAATVCADRLVFASSSSVYGFDTQLPIKETESCCPKSPYAISKLFGENCCSMNFHLHGLAAISLRYFSVFGPRQDADGEYSAVIPKLIKAVKEGREFTVYGDGWQTRDFSYVDNVVQTTMKFIENLETGVVNVAAGIPIAINALVEMVMAKMGKRIPIVRVDEKKGEFRHSCADTTELREHLDVDKFIGLRKDSIEQSSIT